MVMEMGIKNAGLLCLLLLSGVADARDGEFTVTGAVGKTNLGIDSDYRIGVERTSFDAGTLSLMGGYRFSNGFLVEAGYVTYATFEFFNAFDEYELGEWQAAVGYSYELGRWRFVAKAGYAFWQLDSEEGDFLNPGDEDESHADGSDPVATLAIEKFFSSIFGMSLAYQKSDRDFGNTESFMLGFNFAF